MKPREHANLLSIFYWVYAGMQGCVFLLILLVTLMMGGMSIYAAIEGSKGSTEASLMFGIIAVIYGFLLIVGFISIVLNILAGRKLRSGLPVNSRFILTTSIFNFISFLCGGVLLLPFGVAIGAYGIWFLSSPEGSSYLANPMAHPVMPPAYPQYNQAPAQQLRPPYTWQ